MCLLCFCSSRGVSSDRNMRCIWPHLSMCYLELFEMAFLASSSSSGSWEYRGAYSAEDETGCLCLALFPP